MIFRSSSSRAASFNWSMKFRPGRSVEHRHAHHAGAGLCYAQRRGRATALPTSALAGDALDGGAAAGKLLLQPFEAAVEMIDAVDHRLAFGGEPGDDERDRSR